MKKLVDRVGLKKITREGKVMGREKERERLVGGENKNKNKK
jgi:hypothetical protein